MSSRLQLDMRNLSLGRRHLVNAYEVKAGIGVIAGNTVWSMPERFECELLQKARYINTLTFTYLPSPFLLSPSPPLPPRSGPQIQLGGHFEYSLWTDNVDFVHICYIQCDLFHCYIFNYEIMPETLANTLLVILQGNALADLRYDGRF